MKKDEGGYCTKGNCQQDGNCGCPVGFSFHESDCINSKQVRTITYFQRDGIN